MKKTITINYEANTIEITSAFEKTASVYGSRAYKELKAAREDFPAFTVSVIKISPKKNSAAIKGLNYETMARYIKAHDDADSTIMREFKTLSEKSEDNNFHAATYGEIKKWFLNTFPNFEGVRFKADEALHSIKIEKVA